MISFPEAYRVVRDHLQYPGTERLPLAAGIGRVLREDWHGDRELPPYDRVTMDGIAVHYATASRQAWLPIQGVVAAGDPQATLDDPTGCVEIMTGAVLPEGCDTVIRYEDLTIEDGKARVNAPYRAGQNIHRRGEDRAAGELLVEAGTLLSAAEIGLGASIGKATITVARRPRILILSTGNELVPVDQIPEPHQIRRSNVYAIQAALDRRGYPAELAHLMDDEATITEKLTEHLAAYDVLVLSGGVSKGKFDFLPAVLERLGVTKLFHRVAQRPGKPFWFGRHAALGTTVFALPGNPVSSFMCTRVYLLDWLRASAGCAPGPRPLAVLTEEVSFRPDLTYFLEVSIGHDEAGRLTATPRRGRGSGDLANLLRSDAFIRLDRGREVFAAGTVQEVYYYR